MKKYIAFIVSFIFPFLILQVMSGMFFTLTYTPDIAEAWNVSAKRSQETVIKSSHHPFLLIFLLAILSASFAYLIFKKVSSKKTAN